MRSLPSEIRSPARRRQLTGAPAPPAEQKVNFCLTAYAVSGIYVYSGIRVTGGAGSVLQIAALKPAAECVVDTTNNRICVGDRTTAGGEDQRGGRMVSTAMRVLAADGAHQRGGPDLAADDVAQADRIRRHAERRPGSTSIAWVDICDADCYASTTPVNFLRLAANSTALQIASSSLYSGNGKTAHVPVRLDGNLPPQLGRPRRRWQCVRLAVRRLDQRGRAGGLELAQFGRVDGGVPRVLIDGFGNTPVLDLGAVNGTAATGGQVNYDGYNGSAYVNVTASLAVAAAENWTTGAHGTYFSL